MNPFAPLDPTECTPTVAASEEYAALEAERPTSSLTPEALWQDAYLAGWHLARRRRRFPLTEVGAW